MYGHTSIRRLISDALAEYRDNLNICLTIDGMRVDPESNTNEDIREDNTISINMDFGLRDIIFRHPEEFVPELHDPLFTDEEKKLLAERKVAA